MSHIHIPDGVLPLWLILLGWLATALVLSLCVFLLRRREPSHQVPLLGVMSAAMLVGMSLELVPIGYHINLTVLAGVVLGPALGFIAAFVVDLILSLFGHGGITVIGLNTLVIGGEIVLGSYLFRLLYRWSKGLIRSPGKVAGLATAVTLFLTTLLFIGIVGLASIDLTGMVRAGAIEPITLSFRNPLAEGALAVELPGSEGHPEGTGAALDLATFAKMVMILGTIGWIIEATVTGLVVGFVAKVKPNLLSLTRPG